MNLISEILRFVPRTWLQRVAPVGANVLGWWWQGKGTLTDPFTQKTYKHFLPFGRLNARKNALAPASLSLERHRVILLYLQRKTDFFSKHQKVLNIAPEFCFYKLFKSLPNIDYTAADLGSPWADVEMNVENMPFENNSFDFVMCNHVLEHVENAHKAMTEIYRVLRVGGFAILQVPIDSSRAITLEDPTINTPALREKHYWQSDHFRLFGLDYANWLERAGFVVEVDKLVEELSPAEREKYALPPNEYIFVAKKMG